MATFRLHSFAEVLTHLEISLVHFYATVLTASVPTCCPTAHGDYFYVSLSLQAVFAFCFVIMVYIYMLLP